MKQNIVMVDFGLTPAGYESHFHINGEEKISVFNPSVPDGDLARGRWECDNKFLEQQGLDLSKITVNGEEIVPSPNTCPHCGKDI